MKSSILKVALVICAYSLGLGQADAEVRNALVIGNGDYQQVGALENPPNDAKLMAQTLRDLDFNVIEVIDASQLDMKRAVRDFGSRLNDAGKEGVGLFYFAGHGVQVSGANYIIPVDAQISSEGDVDIEAINANSVLRMMEFSNARLSFIVLDACRNNPYSRGFRSATRGLAKMSAPTGSFVAYATSPGDVAVDGKGANSPYTASLAKHMNEPGVPIEKVFRNVRNEVRAATSNQQTPWESSSLIGDDYYFKTVVEIETTPKGQEVTVTSTGSDGVSNTVAAGTTNRQSGAAVPVVINTPKDPSIELVFWDSVKDSKNPAVVNAYISKFPEGIFVELAKLKIDAMGGLNTQQNLSPSEPVSAPKIVEAPEPPVQKVVEPPKPPVQKVIEEPLQEVVLATVADPTVAILNECDSHLSDNRLTTGDGGNAYDCYRQILRTKPNHPDALAGMVEIEKKYAQWASSALNRNNFIKAKKNIDKLRLVNSNNVQLAALDGRLADSIAKQQAAEKKAEKPQKIAAVKKEKVAAVKKKKTVATGVVQTSGSQKCKAYLDSGKLSGSGSNNAWECYGAILASSPDDSTAKDGRLNTEIAMYKKFRGQIDAKNLEGAERVMRQMRRMNKRSTYYKKMRPWYEELKMENRW